MKKIIHLTLFLAIVSAIAGGALAFAGLVLNALSAGRKKKQPPC